MLIAAGLEDLLIEVKPLLRELAVVLGLLEVQGLDLLGSPAHQLLDLGVDLLDLGRTVLEARVSLGDQTPLLEGDDLGIDPRRDDRAALVIVLAEAYEAFIE